MTIQIKNYTKKNPDNTITKTKRDEETYTMELVYKHTYDARVAPKVHKVVITTEEGCTIQQRLEVADNMVKKSVENSDVEFYEHYIYSSRKIFDQ